MTENVHDVTRSSSQMCPLSPVQSTRPWRIVIEFIPDSVITPNLCSYIHLIPVHSISLKKPVVLVRFNYFRLKWTRHCHVYVNSCTVI